MLIKKRSLVLFSFLLCAGSIFCAEKTISYRHQVEPLLKTYCLDCHGPDKQENGVRIDDLDLDFVWGRDRETWHDILDMLNLGDMPPDEDPQPSNEERQLIVDWVTAEMTAAAEERFGQMAKEQGTSYDQVVEDWVREWRIPAEKFGNIDDFGAICALLCSAQASYIVGQSLVVDGGATTSTF